MGVPAAGGIGAGGHAGFLKVTPFFFADIKVIMIGGLLDQLVKVLVEMIAVHALIARAGHGMPEVADDGVDENYECGNADGDCAGAEEVEDGIADDGDNGDDGVILMLATYVCP